MDIIPPMDQQPQPGDERQKDFYGRILRFISPSNGYIVVIDQRPYKLKGKAKDGEENVFMLEEILQLPEPEDIPITAQYREAELLELLTRKKANLFDPEGGHQYLANRMGSEKIQVGDVITVTFTKSRRRVVEVLENLGGIRTEKIISTPEGKIEYRPESKPWDMNSLVTGLLSGKITVKRHKKAVPIA